VDVGLAQPLERLAQEERAQVRDLLAPLSQWRDVDPDHAQAVVQIFAELAFRDALLEIRVGRRDHADVDALRFGLADGHDLVLLEEAQQLRLDVDRQSPISSRNSVPPDAVRISPGWSLTAP